MKSDYFKTEYLNIITSRIASNIVSCKKEEKFFFYVFTTASLYQRAINVFALAPQTKESNRRPGAVEIASA
jgi:hypothetical protein